MVHTEREIMNKVNISGFAMVFALALSACGSNSTRTVEKKAGDTPQATSNWQENEAIVGISPAAGSPPTAFCRRNESELNVRFENTGGRPFEGDMTVTVTFQGYQPVQQKIGYIPAAHENSNGIINIPFTIPQGCFNPDCEFEIQWSNHPAVSGICIG